MFCFVFRGSQGIWFRLEVCMGTGNLQCVCKKSSVWEVFIFTEAWVKVKYVRYEHSLDKYSPHSLVITMNMHRFLVTVLVLEVT